MANMGYCRFRNTLKDLQDCEHYLSNDGPPESPEEQLALKKMVQLARDLVEWAEVNKEYEE